MIFRLWLSSICLVYQNIFDPMTVDEVIFFCPVLFSYVTLNYLNQFIEHTAARCWPPCFFLMSQNDSFSRKCACRQASGRALIPWLDLLLNSAMWMRGCDLAHLRWRELMPYYPWAVVKLLKTPLPPFNGRHNSQCGYRDVTTEIDLRTKCNPVKT